MTPIWIICDDRVITHLLSLLRRQPEDLVVVIVQQDVGDARKHLLEVLLQARDVLAVADDLQQVFISHEVEPASRITGQNQTRAQKFKLFFLCTRTKSRRIRTSRSLALASTKMIITPLQRPKSHSVHI